MHVALGYVMASRAGSPRKDKTIPDASQDKVTTQALEELREQYVLLSNDAKQLMT